MPTLDISTECPSNPSNAPTSSDAIDSDTPQTLATLAISSEDILISLLAPTKVFPKDSPALLSSERILVPFISDSHFPLRSFCVTS